MAIAKKLIVPGLATVGVVSGIVPLAANAETANTTQSSSSSTTKNATGGGTTTTQNNSNSQQQGAPSGPHQANGKTETALTGTDLEKATAAAKAKVSDATVERAETDADGDGTYEVHMKKSDGSEITVFLDANFNVTSTANGMSNKGPQGGQRDSQQSQSSSSNSSSSN